MGKGKKCREDSSASSSDDDASPMPLADMDLLDHGRHCPRYSAILGRSGNDECVGLEDIDSLQVELETLLVTAVKRKLNVEQEMESLSNWQDKPLIAKKTATKSEKEMSAKRKATKELGDDRPVKKVKEISSSGSSSSASSVISTISSKSSKKKNKVAAKTQEYVDYDVAVEPQQNRNDIPDRFCQFIDAYCAPIKPEHVKILEDILKTYDEDSDLYKVPNLGKHYSLKWTTSAPDESSWESKSGKECKSIEKKKGLSAANSVAATDKMRNGKRPNNEKNDTEKGGFGALTQRLISCLMEEQGIGALNESLDAVADIEAIAGKNGNANILKGLNATNAVQLEKRIKKELEENGLLDLDEMITPADLSGTDDDEILRELIRSQYELKLISSQNQSQLRTLLSHAKADLAKQDLKKKLTTADNELIEIYRRFLQAKQKKRPLSRKEKEQASKALREREELTNQLDNFKLTT